MSALLTAEDQPSFRFEATTTLEAIRQMMAQFADERDWNEASSSYHTPRNLVLALTGELGELCELFQWKHDGMLVKVKNALKYPPSAHLQVPKTWTEPSVSPVSQEPQSSFCFEPTTTLELVRAKTAHFADERGWNPNLTPRNLLLALTGEVGELCEIFQWKGDHIAVADWPQDEKVHLGEELSDVLLYLVQLANKCAVDLPVAVKDKMVKNAKKYPAELVKGSSKKYNEYKQLKRN
uniref:dCTP pyrophosphatase 1 n=1 Tax=Globisporangium ultimum (strain ATCC 200006 / CBS 805.95 / DAOM BR144) TaxID=431595 RepID=K3X2M1_GLOUD